MGNRPRPADPFAIDTRLARALAHPVRVRILGYLRERGAASPSELAKAWDVSINLLAYHFRRLHTLGLIRVSKRIQRRGAIEHRYSLTAEAPGEEPLTVRLIR
ncbi:winged helix-turn-helix domain-containing protein [Conexibacter woesei]|uniref:Transcriptional regulator, ArsR family n=1 Tax=Conexibacter woesei (strain DSM 14684 / CCUG 47730 / CIP 108061 / JCM 11494 / NBRC 100937 / ID131577) TaxID=469383 RepID=D3F3B1_CONWI|nr:helix-turn-helix domain-containing protein [Conexibacter woesei]ADB50391.1 transcriptional regulator, ArsR family [Conexibacter woesei DSM 14684]